MFFSTPQVSRSGSFSLVFHGGEEEEEFLQRDIRIFPLTQDISATTGCTGPIPFAGLKSVWGKDGGIINGEKLTD